MKKSKSPIPFLGNIRTWGYPNKSLKSTTNPRTAKESQMKKDTPDKAQPSITRLTKSIFERLKPQYGHVH